MDTTEYTLHTAKLNNNCPKCYTTSGLEISFVQEGIENRFYAKKNKTISETLYCSICNNTIYPVNWTEDIEKVYQYHNKQAIPKNSKIELKRISYGIIIFFLMCISVLIYFIINT